MRFACAIQKCSLIGCVCVFFFLFFSSSSSAWKREKSQINDWMMMEELRLENLHYRFCLFVTSLVSLFFFFFFCYVIQLCFENILDFVWVFRILVFITPEKHGILVCYNLFVLNESSNRFNPVLLLLPLSSPWPGLAGEWKRISYITWHLYLAAFATFCLLFFFFFSIQKQLWPGKPHFCALEFVILFVDSLSLLFERRQTCSGLWLISLILFSCFFFFSAHSRSLCYG